MAGEPTLKRIDSQRTAGFSMVEVVVATAILVFGIYGVYDQFLATRDLGRRREADLRARLLAEKRLEELRAAPYAALAARASRPFAPIPGENRFYLAEEISSREDGTVAIAVVVARDPRRADPLEFDPGSVTTVRGERAP